MKKLGDKERLILEILRDHGEKFGLEMIVLSGGRLSRGIVYVRLAAMEEAGLVEGRPEEHAPSVAFPCADCGEVELIPRRKYRILASGLHALVEREQDRGL